MRLEPLMNLHADLKPPAGIGVGPFGGRQIYDVTGGTFEGERLRGRLLPSGGDWLLVDAGGVGRLDVRATLETDDGALIYVQYYGVVVINDKVVSAGQGGPPTEYGDTEFFTQPRFETGDARYDWLNRAMAIAEGRALPGAVEYRIYLAANG
jgi:Protein of unknown function (DUF3237)